MMILLTCNQCGKPHQWRGARYIRRCEECRAETRRKVLEAFKVARAKRK